MVRTYDPRGYTSMSIKSEIINFINWYYKNYKVNHDIIFDIRDAEYLYELYPFVVYSGFFEYTVMKNKICDPEIKITICLYCTEPIKALAHEFAHYEQYKNEGIVYHGEKLNQRIFNLLIEKEFATKSHTKVK